MCHRTSHCTNVNNVLTQLAQQILKNAQQILKNAQERHLYYVIILYLLESSLVVNYQKNQC